MPTYTYSATVTITLTPVTRKSTEHGFILTLPGEDPLIRWGFASEADAFQDAWLRILAAYPDAQFAILVGMTG